MPACQQSVTNMYNPYNYASGMNNMGVASYMPTQLIQNNNLQPAFSSQPTHTSTSPEEREILNNLINC